MPTGIYKHQKHTDLQKICLICQKEFRVVYGKRDRKYCSYRCYWKSKIGKPTWSKGKKLNYQVGSAFPKGHIPWIKGKYHTLEAKKKMSENHKGLFLREKSALWRGGISFEPYSTDWTETLRRAMRERDHYICQLCSQYGNACHHIDYNKKNCNPENLITLCVSCNTKVNKNREYWTDYFNQKMQ